MKSLSKALFFFLISFFICPKYHAQTSDESIATCHQDFQRFDNGNSSSSASSGKTLATNSRSDSIDILKYTINLNITDFTTDIIRGNTQVKFTPKLNATHKICLDLLKLTIDSIKLNTSKLTWSYNDTLIVADLASTLNIGDTVTITVYYYGKPQLDAGGAGWGGFYFQSGYAYNLGVAFQSDPHSY